MFIGGLDDQISLIVWSQVSSLISHFKYPVFYSSEVLNTTFLAYLNPMASNEPLTWFFASVFATLAGIYANNLLVILNVLLNLFVSHLYFRKFKYGWVFTFLFTFSSFAWIHMGKHPDLGVLWTIPLTALVLETPSLRRSKKVTYLVLLTLITALISNYLGFFLVLFITFDFFASFVIHRTLRKEIALSVLFYLVFSVSLLVLVFLPYIKINYLDAVDAQRTLPVDRSQTDLIQFSARPWYLLIPSPKNPIHGSISQCLIDIGRDTGYFLADDYFQGEHDGLFFGYLFLTCYLCLLAYTFVTFKKPLNNVSSDTFFKYTAVAFLLFIYAMPPFFTISGVKILTPNYFLFTLVPFFRVSARIAVFIQFSLLAGFAYGLRNLQLKNSFSTVVLMSILFVTTILETFVPPKIYKVPDAPPAYRYLSEQKEFSKFAVYPFVKAKEAFYFLPLHKKDLVNVRGFKNSLYESESFTKNLISEDGLAFAKKMGVRYILVFKVSSEVDQNVFHKNSNLVLEKEFTDSYLYKLY